MTENASTSTPRVAVFATVSMESRLRGLETRAELIFPESQQVSMETQQLEEKEKIDNMIDQHERLRALLKDERTTGAAHLYILEPEALANSDPAAQSTLQALANAQLDDKTSIVAAMLPPSTGYTDAGLAALDLLKPDLENGKVVTVESFDDLLALLNR